MKGEMYALMAAFTWGCALVLFKRSSDHMQPISLNLFKNLVGLAFLGATIPLVGDFLSPLQMLTWKELGLLALSGILGIAVADSLLFASLKRIGVTRVSIVDCLYSPSIIFFSWAFLDERIGISHLVGAALILSGILLSTLRRTSSASEDSEDSEDSTGQLWVGVLLGALAILSMTLGIIIVKPLLERLPLLWSSALRMLVGTVALSAWLAVVQPRALRELFIPHESWKFSIPASFLGSYLSMVLWIGGFKYAKASIAGLLNQSTIIFAILLSAVFLREKLTQQKMLAVLAAAGGVLIVTLRPW